MGAGSFGADPGQPGPYAQGGWQPPPPYSQRRTNSLAIAALCCGVGSYLVGPFASIPAIILGAMSLKQIRQTGEDGHAMAVAGVVLGIIGTLLFLVGIILVVAFAAFAFNHACVAGTSSPSCA